LIDIVYKFNIRPLLGPVMGNCLSRSQTSYERNERSSTRSGQVLVDKQGKDSPVPAEADSATSPADDVSSIAYHSY